MQSSFLWIFGVSAIFLCCSGCKESNSRSPEKRYSTTEGSTEEAPRINTKQNEPSAPSLEGEFYCRVRNLPNSWPEYVFRCSIEKAKEPFVLRSLEDTETRLSIHPSSQDAVNINGVVFIKERIVGKRYPKRWVVIQESSARVSTVSGKPYLEGTVKAVLQFESERIKGNRKDFRKGTSTPRGQEHTIEFVVSR